MGTTWYTRREFVTLPSIVFQYPHGQIMFDVYSLAIGLAGLDTDRAFSLKTRRS